MGEKFPGIGNREGDDVYKMLIKLKLKTLQRIGVVLNLLKIVDRVHLFIIFARCPQS